MTTDKKTFDNVKHDGPQEFGGSAPGYIRLSDTFEKSSFNQYSDPDFLREKLEFLNAFVSESKEAIALVKDAVPQLEAIARSIRDCMIENAQLKLAIDNMKNRVNAILLLKPALDEMHADYVMRMTPLPPKRKTKKKPVGKKRSL